MQTEENSNFNWDFGVKRTLWKMSFNYNAKIILNVFLYNTILYFKTINVINNYSYIKIIHFCVLAFEYGAEFGW